MERPDGADARAKTESGIVFPKFQKKRRDIMSKVHIRHGDNEIEVEGSDAFIKKQLDGFYARVHQVQPVSAPATLKKDIQDSASKKPVGKALTPAEFYKSKNRTDGVAQILIFGKYLEEYRGIAEFTRSEVDAVTGNAKISKRIHSQYFTNAVKQGLLRSLGGGKYSLTLSAEDALAAMK